MRTHLAVAFLCVVAVATLPAQTEDQAPAATFPAEVEQVIVDVVVTDKKGVPVEGLTAADLIVEEDGKRQAIETFEAIALPAEPTPMEPPPPRISVNTTPEAKRGRTFVIVFDDANITPFKARDAKAAVESFLANGVREGDYVTLLSSSGDAWWTSRMNAGREKLLGVLARLDGLYIPNQARDRITDWEAMQIHVYRNRNVGVQVYQRLKEFGIVQDRPGVDPRRDITVMTEDPFVTSRAAEVYYRAQARNQGTLNAIERALNGLSEAQGRKSLVLVSEGFIYDPNMPEFREVSEASRRANTVIYFLNARGLDPMPTDLTPAFATALPQADLGYVFQETYNAVEGPESVASESGGFTIRNTNDLASGIQRIADETRVYYLLGYTPTNLARDGKFRRIKVELRDGKGRTVRARKGYYAPSPDGEVRADVAPGVDPDFQAALDSPWAEDAIPLRMTHYVGGEATPGKASALLVAEVDIRELAFETVDEHFVGAIEFLLVVTHRESGEYFRMDQTVDMELQPATRERINREWYPIVRDFELLPGDHQAKIVVREPATGRIGSVIHEFDVPALDGFRVSTPIVSDLFYQKPEGGEVVPKFLARREFVQGSALLCKFDVFGAALDDEGMPRVAQGYEVRGPDGRVYADVAETVIKPTSLGALTRLVAFPLRDAVPGEYEIRLRFEDELGGERLELREPFTVVAAPAGEGKATPVASSSGG
jgi:VWFA-related protein